MIRWLGRRIERPGERCCGIGARNVIRAFQFFVAAQFSNGTALGRVVQRSGTRTEAECALLPFTWWPIAGGFSVGLERGAELAVSVVLSGRRRRVGKEPRVLAINPRMSLRNV